MYIEMKITNDMLFYPRQKKKVTAKRIECKENQNKHAQKGTCNCPPKRVFSSLGFPLQMLFSHLLHQLWETVSQDVLNGCDRLACQGKEAQCSCHNTVEHVSSNHPFCKKKNVGKRRVLCQKKHSRTTKQMSPII